MEKMLTLCHQVGLHRNVPDLVGVHLPQRHLVGCSQPASRDDFYFGSHLWIPFPRQSNGRSHQLDLQPANLGAEFEPDLRLQVWVLHEDSRARDVHWAVLGHSCRPIHQLRHDALRYRQYWLRRLDRHQDQRQLACSPDSKLLLVIRSMGKNEIRARVSTAILLMPAALPCRV